MVLNMKIIFLFCLLLASATFFGQDTASNGNNQLSFKTFRGWQMNGQKLTYKEFKNEIYKVPAAVPYLKKSKNSTVIYYSLLAPFTFFVIKGLQKNDFNSPRYGKNNTGYKIAAFATGGISLFFLIRSQKQRDEAVRIHNNFYQ